MARSARKRILRAGWQPAPGLVSTRPGGLTTRCRLPTCPTADILLVESVDFSRPSTGSRRTSKWLRPEIRCRRACLLFWGSIWGVKARRSAPLALILLICSWAAGQQLPKVRKQKQDKEPPTQTLPLQKEPPAAVAAETSRLTFQVSPLSDKGLLS